jgi:hypothetical protein
MDQIIESGRSIVYVGVPIMGGATGGRNPRYEIINRIIEEEAAKRTGAFYVDAWSVFQDADGGYAQYLPDDSGEPQKMRADDDVHLERPGGDRLAAVVLDLLERTWGSTPSSTTTPPGAASGAPGP